MATVIKFPVSSFSSSCQIILGAPGKPSKLSVNQDLGVKVATPVGTLCGQLLFGWLADLVGRKRMYGVELMIIIIGTFAQALSSGNHAVSIVGVLVVWRFIVGFLVILYFSVALFYCL
jgi:PHS family inorganic phosphate transporter-like MFS transporter